MLSQFDVRPGAPLVMPGLPLWALSYCLLSHLVVFWLIFRNLFCWCRSQCRTRQTNSWSVHHQHSTVFQSHSWHLCYLWVAKKQMWFISIETCSFWQAYLDQGPSSLPLRSSLCGTAAFAVFVRSQFCWGAWSPASVFFFLVCTNHASFT